MANQLVLGVDREKCRISTTPIVKKETISITAMTTKDDFHRSIGETGWTAAASAVLIVTASAVFTNGSGALCAVIWPRLSVTAT